MKRHISLILAVSLALSLAGCGNTTQTKDQTPTTKVETQSVQPEETESTVTVSSTESATEAYDKDMAELSAIGNVEVENGLLTVSITLPQDFVGDTTQEEIDANANGNYVSGKLNEDGSVTYKMTKSQHHAMLEQFKTGIEESLQDLIDDDENYSISDIKCDEAFTKFDVTLDSEDVGLADSFTTIVFYMAGGIYGRFTGKMPENIEVNFIDPDGKIIETANSKDMN